MAKTDWDSAAKLFALENERTGISVQDWCERNGLNYQSARRYLKSRGQSPSSKKDSRVQAPNGKSKSSKTAQTAQKPVRKTNAQNNSAQSAQCANDSIGTDDENDSPEIESAPINDSKCHGSHRDSKGRFIDGNPGNFSAVAEHCFKPGHKLSTKHSGYAKYFPQTEYFDDAELMSLHDELTFTRARVISVTKNLQKMHEDLSSATEIPDRIALYGKITAAEQALDRNVARVESLTKTISSIRIDDVTVPHRIADEAKMKAQTEKLKAETDKLGRKSTADSVVFQFDW